MNREETMPTTLRNAMKSKARAAAVAKEHENGPKEWGLGLGG